MNHWLKEITLHGNLVRLEPLSLEHTKGLELAVQDGELWKLWYTTAPEPLKVSEYIERALSEMQQGSSLPFAVIRQEDDTVLGTTRYMHIDHQTKRLEIGSTWYAKSVQRSGVNTECKFLLLRHAFEDLNCVAVEFRTHWHNLASRNAIARLGAKQDGILRNHLIDKTGGLRDTVVFSILNSEWHAVKQSLLFKMKGQY
ncbi:MAG: N-acetyltransferase [Bacteroidetes bacterium]|nr:MAG: N-acetyltransferase [Bacteroidota bacterium]